MTLLVLKYIFLCSTLLWAGRGSSTCSDVLVDLLSLSSNTSTTLLQPTVNNAAFYPVYFHVPQYKQTTNFTCGPSSMLSVLLALGFTNVTEDSLMDEMQTNAEIGTNLSQMVGAVQRRGLQHSVMQDASIQDIRNSLSMGWVVIILYQAWSGETNPYINVWDSGHFSVVYGIDTENIILMDPWTGEYGYMPFQYFSETRWHSPDEFGMYGICARCMLAVGPRTDGSPRVFSQVPPPTSSSLIFIG